jgi:hypothetical protein
VTLSPPGDPPQGRPRLDLRPSAAAPGARSGLAVSGGQPFAVFITPGQPIQIYPLTWDDPPPPEATNKLLLECPCCGKPIILAAWEDGCLTLEALDVETPPR